MNWFLRLKLGRCPYPLAAFSRSFALPRKFLSSVPAFLIQLFVFPPNHLLLGCVACMAKQAVEPLLLKLLR